MNRKTLIIYILLALLFVAGIGVGVGMLYREDTPAPSGQSISQFSLLRAVPTDAAAVVHFSDTREGMSLLNDPSRIFSIFTDIQPGMKSFARQADSLLAGARSLFRSQNMAVSLHYSGSVVPLAVFSVPRSASDSTGQVKAIRDIADSCRLASSFYDGDGLKVLLVSSSETLVSSAVRHMDEGQSILENSSFAECLSKCQSKDVTLFSGPYSGKLLQTYFRKPVSSHASFLKTVGAWTGLSLLDAGEYSTKLAGCFSGTDDAGAFWKVIASQESTQAAFAKVVPSGTYFAVSVPMKDQNEYAQAYSAYLDSKSSLAAGRQRLSALAKKSGVDPSVWAKALGVKEVVKAQWRTSADSSFEAVFVKVSDSSSSILKNLTQTDSLSDGAYPYSGFAAALYGGVFSLSDESAFAVSDGWIVSGASEAVADFQSRHAEGDVLAALLGDASVSSLSSLKDCSLAAYFSPGGCSPAELFSPVMLDAVQSTLDGAALEPCMLTARGGGFTLETTRVPFLNKSRTPAVVADAAVEVPSGPFKVTNSGTGRTNLLSQQANMYLSLKEEDGTGIWSVPFSEPLCGRVETIDYYVNGKLQFLFTAGSKLWLLDRLGRFVSGFPAELGKPVLLGPSVYDFSGAHGYSVVVLHDDNTIGMYNIHGQAPESWQGITSDEKIIDLPVLFKCGGKSYWAVRTAVQTQIFSFYGGEPVYRQDGAKSIRRDSDIEVTESGALRVTCNDGKTRNIKI